MKKSYKKILIFSIINFIILFLNSFVWNILGNNKIIVLYIIDILVFFKLLGFEKSKHRFKQEALWDITIFLLSYFLIYYIAGIFITFVRTENYFTVSGFTTFIIPIFVSIILREVLRYMVVSKLENNSKWLVVVCLLFVFFDISNNLYFASLSGARNIFNFFALTFLPSLSISIMSTLLIGRVGYVPIIYYLIVMKLYPYILPIVPNPSEYLVSLIGLLVPLILTRNIVLVLNKVEDEEIDRDYKKRKVIFLLIPSIVVLVLAYLVSGYFRYEAFAIASNSMFPVIEKGDAVIIDKENNDIKKNDIIAYEYGNTVIVHRVVNIVKDRDEVFYYTKGDGNHDSDNYPVEKDKIIGVVDYVVPVVGMPTVWLNSLS